MSITNPAALWLLALLPLVRAGWIDLRGIVVDAKSGVSGAGRAPTLTTHYGECNENLRPYSVPGHRHVPEMEQELGRLAGCTVRVAFTPHLVPMSRGMLSVVYARVSPVPSADDLYQLYQEWYRGEPFVEVLRPGELPATAHVRGSNRCQVSVTVDRRTGTVVIFSAIDNLGKGAAGQAVQNLNVMMGWAEDAGLQVPALFP